jgi:hypothetical protein
MIRWFFSLLVCMGLSSGTTAFAADTALGLGFSTAGSGLSGYSEIRPGGFVQGLLGITAQNPSLVADYCQERPVGDWTAYYGGGAIFQLGRTNAGVGVHIPLGVYYRAQNSPLLLNFDVSPGILATERDTVPVVDLTAGLRFFL